MDSSPSPEEQEAQGETKPGPANPAAEGLDAPTPPGGPQRQDAAGGTPGEEHHEASADGPGSSTIPIEDEQPDPGETAGSAAEALREENAATSLDQPSDGVA
jgi:hypothetical protein